MIPGTFDDNRGDTADRHAHDPLMVPGRKRSQEVQPPGAQCLEARLGETLLSDSRVVACEDVLGARPKKLRLSHR